jgi:hypothetical protein
MATMCFSALLVVKILDFIELPVLRKILYTQHEATQHELNRVKCEGNEEG